MSLAPAVTKDGFSYAGDLFAEASGHNRHRRATVTELKDHFKSGSVKDHPAHWFEAQLIHYGLQPSKTKAIGRMRLYDAVNGGKLSVPSHISKLEADLKKEWTKKEREAKKAIKDAAVATPVAKTAKRKAESSNVDLTVNVGGINISVSATNSNKKAKTTTTTTPAKPEPKARTPKGATAPKATPKTKPTPKPKAKPAAASTSTTASPVPKKRTARRGGLHQGPPRGSTATAPAPPTSTSSPPRPRTKQTARRSRPFFGARSAGRTPSNVVTLSDSDDDPPPPYTETANFGRGDGNLRPLGLLNGKYEIESPYVEEQWGHAGLELTLTLDGTQLWGSFDLGVVSGVLRFGERPWQSSYSAVEFTYRGREQEGPMIYGDDNRGWIKFLGDGHIEGMIDYMDIKFYGDRVSGQGTRSQVSVSSMKDEWNGYNAREYDREGSARWH